MRTKITSDMLNFDDDISITGSGTFTGNVTASVFYGDASGLSNLPESSSYSTWMSAGAFTRSDDNTFTVTDNAANQIIFSPGRPIRYRETSGIWRYGQVVSYIAGTVDLSGCPLTVTDDDEMQYGDFTRIVRETFSIPGVFADAADTTLLANDLLMSYNWKHGRAYLVNASHRVGMADTGASQPGVNVMINGSGYISSYSTVAATQVEIGTTNVSNTNYDINYNESLELAADAAGSNDDAKNLTFQLAFCLE